MSILLTGGAGFLGSHTAAAMIEAGYEVVIADNLSNAEVQVIDRIEEITGVRPKFYPIDVSDASALAEVFEENHIEGVIHFAGYKSVPESTKMPLRYYRNNLDSAVTVLEAMDRFSCRAFVFSSSATVYGANNPIPYTEDMPTGAAASPYGTTKWMIEQIAMDVCQTNPAFSAVLLRYFNPIGAHPSGLIGEAPSGIPNNLMPYITQVAVGRREYLNIYGNDYPTRDGTGIRDYIHVMDLAEGHVKALDYALHHTGAEPINLGTGRGSSVLEVVSAFEEANHLHIPVKMAPRRPGDLPEFYAEVSKAERLLGWKARYSLQEMCADAFRWQKNNPNGFAGK